MRRLGIGTCCVGGCALLMFLGGCGRDLVFTTYSTIGVELKGVDNVPTAVRLAYKRFEGAIVPVQLNRDEAHSVFSSLEFEQRGFGIKLAQVFATGEAADGAAATSATAPTADTGFKKTLDALQHSVARDGG